MHRLIRERGQEVVQKVSAVALAAFMLGGCSLASVTKPQTLPALSAYEEKLIQRYSTGHIPKDAYVSAHSRNTVLNELIILSNRAYIEYEVSIYSTHAVMNTVTDVVVMAAGAGAAAAGGSAAQALGAVTAAVTGVRASVDKNFFAEQSRIALITKMSALRWRVLEDLQIAMELPIELYPIQAGLIDIQRYVHAGSVLAALQAIVEDSGADLQRTRSDMMSHRRSLGRSAENLGGGKRPPAKIRNTK